MFSFFNIFQLILHVERCGVTSHCLYRDLLTLAFQDKGVRVLGLHIWNHLLETLIVKSSFQILERFLNDWFRILLLLVFSI